MAATQLRVVPTALEIDKLFGVQGKNVLVTGGGRGIGYMIAEGFVRNGANVFLVSRDGTALQKAAAELQAAGPGRCTALPPIDLSSKAACDSVATTLSGLVTKLHVLVNNSGVAWGEPMESYAEKGWDKVMNVNLKAVFYLTVACLPLLRAAATHEDPARVINIGSIVGVFPQLAPTYAYDSSKAAVHSLTIKMAADLVKENISVNAIAPGLVPSKMSNQLTKYVEADALAATVPRGRIGNPGDMAGAALYFASQAGAWVTGVVLAVDGGNLLPGIARSSL